MNGEWGIFYTGGWYASNKRVRKRSNLSIACSNLVFLSLLFYLFLDSDYIFISELLIPSIKHPFIFPSAFFRLLSPFSWTLIYLRMIKIYRTRQPFDFLAASTGTGPSVWSWDVTILLPRAMLFRSRIGLAIYSLSWALNKWDFKLSKRRCLLFSCWPARFPVFCVGNGCNLYVHPRGRMVTHFACFSFPTF